MHACALVPELHIHHGNERPGESHRRRIITTAQISQGCDRYQTFPVAKQKSNDGVDATCKLLQPRSTARTLNLRSSTALAFDHSALVLAPMHFQVFLDRAWRISSKLCSGAELEGLDTERTGWCSRSLCRFDRSNRTPTTLGDNVRAAPLFTLMHTLQPCCLVSIQTLGLLIRHLLVWEIAVLSPLFAPEKPSHGHGEVWRRHRWDARRRV